MRITQTKLEGLYLIEPELHEDERGYFARTFCLEELQKRGLKFEIVQVSMSFNKRAGTIRGMHFQKPPKEEGKIVQCLKGAIFDVAIDLRASSPTFCRWHGEELTEKNGKMLLVPKGYAHGFQTLANNTKVQYFMSEFYFPSHSFGVRWNDPKFCIKWPMEPTAISEKDKGWPYL